MKGSAWYVVQVQTGRETIVSKMIERACEAADEASSKCGKILQECFSPSFARQRKLHGEWVDEERPLLPGYVIAVTDDPWTLLRVLKGIPEFTKLLAMGTTFAPLKTDEKSWIERWTHKGERTIPMSVAYKDGDRIVITDGPLVGQEALIMRVNRHKSVAHLEIHAGQITIRSTVGLAVLPRRPKARGGT